MNNKTATLGIGAALIGVLTALVGAALAGKPSAKPLAKDDDAADGKAGDDAFAQPYRATSTASSGGSHGITPGQPAAALAPMSDSDGPSGPTAPVQPAPTRDEGHAAPDLASDAPLGADHRAPAAFRPDMDAPMTPAEREALRPATGPSPSMVSPEGTGVQPSRDCS